MKMKRRIGLLGVLICMTFLAGCPAQKPKPTMIPEDPANEQLKPVQSTEKFRREYVLAPGDEVDVVVRKAPEVSRHVLIRPDGRMTLPVVDDVMAAGLTPSELDAELTQQLAERLLNPDVTVIATMVRPPTVYVTGLVRHPQAILLRDAPTAAQAVAVAGGLDQGAAGKVIVIIRLNAEGFIEAIPIEYDGSGQPLPYMAMLGVHLQPDDIVFVPESNRSQTARFIDEFLLRPFWAINQALQSYISFRIIRDQL